jgi:hypothetical protein
MPIHPAAARNRRLPYQSVSAYPLQKSLAGVGVVVAAAAAAVTMSALLFVVVLAVFLCAGALWRRGEPALVWSIGYQWVFVFAGYTYWLLTDSYPVVYSRQHLETAVLMSVIAFVVITLGIRTSIAAAAPRAWDAPEIEQAAPAAYSIRALFVVIVALSAVDWFMQVSPMGIFFNAAQIIFRLLEFRRIFFFLLLITALRRNEGYGYCGLAVAVTLIPTLSSPMSAFQFIFLMVLLAVASEWRPWLTSRRERRRSTRRLAGILGAVAVLGLLAIVWNGAVKYEWRAKVLGGTVAHGTLAAASEFAGTAGDALSNINWETAMRLFFQRLSSSLGFFSLVLDRVPALLPYEGGALTMRTVQHVTTPRVLFPDKAIVDSASWMIRLYAGQSAAGSESGTSIGLTYVAEFYIDYGPVGMFVGLFVLGLIIGLIYCGLRRAAPSYDFFRGAAIALFPLHFAGYESELLKEFGGMLQAFLVYGAVMWAVGPWMHRSLLKTGPLRPSRWRSPHVPLGDHPLPDARVSR